MRTQFVIEYDAGESHTANELFSAIIDRVVKLTGPQSYYNTADDVYVIRMDKDGDIVVCELDERGMPLLNQAIAIPQSNIRCVYVATGRFS